MFLKKQNKTKQKTGLRSRLQIGKLNTLRPRQNGHHFADDTFKCIFLNESVPILFKISLKFVPLGPVNNIPVLVQLMAWRRPGDKPLSEPMIVVYQCIYASLGRNELREISINKILLTKMDFKSWFWPLPIIWDWWISLTRVQNCEALFFVIISLKKLLNKQWVTLLVIWDEMTPMWRQCNVIPAWHYMGYNNIIIISLI